MLGGSDFILCQKSYQNQALGSILSTWGLGALILYTYNHISSIYNHIHIYVYIRIYIYIYSFSRSSIFSKKTGGGQVLCVFVCEVFVLHCFACCPLMSFGKCLVYMSLHCSVCFPFMSFWKCLVYIVLCAVLWEVFGLHCLLCCPFGIVWFTSSCVLSFGKCLAPWGCPSPERLVAFPGDVQNQGPAPLQYKTPPK